MRVEPIGSILYIEPIQRVTRAERVKRKENKLKAEKMEEIYDTDTGKYVDITIGGSIFGKYSILKNKSNL
jgi:hypothetical protein